MKSGNLYVAVILAANIFAVPVSAQVRPGMGGNVGETRTAASAYRAQVRNIVGQMTTELADSWDGLDPSKPAQFYDPNASLVVGPDEILEGREAIRKAFAARLGRMRGVAFTIEGFDMSDELTFVRGTMSYEIIRPGTASKRETMGFTMALRLKRGVWVIQSHSIFGPPVLPD